ncbi:hypothetical protein MMC24_005690 [Lignoscripta atroalba]|nr:hypothetical protein [Lignoscripta atroalba]
MASLDTYVVTFNCARELVEPDAFARHIVDSLPKDQAPELVVLSLQELAPIAYSFLGGSYLTPYLNAFHRAVELATTSWGDFRYINIITRNAGMTAIMAFIREDYSEHVQWLETAGVGLGLQEMGNKGAVGLRLGYSVEDGVLELAFVAAHLAPMEYALSRRNEDWKNLVQRLIFTRVDNKPGHTNTRIRRPQPPTEEAAALLSDVRKDDTNLGTQIYTATSHLVLAGDLNYRTSRVKPSPEDHQAYPQPTKDITHPKHFSNLLKEDQLKREMKAQRTCHGLQEAPIDFPPTYKYSVKQSAMAETNKGTEWVWSKHRWPSWCDRILYLDLPSWMKSDDPSTQIQIRGYTALPLMSASDHRPVALSLSIPLKAIPPPTDEITDEDVRVRPPFPIDPQWRAKRQRARRKEILVGIIAYLGLTWEGNAVLLAIILGALGGWIIIRSMLEV